MSVLRSLNTLSLGALIFSFLCTVPSAKAQDSGQLRERAAALLGTVAAVSEQELKDPRITLGHAPVPRWQNGLCQLSLPRESRC